MLTQISQIVPFLEKSLNAKIIDCTTTPLAAKGAHYGSTMLSVKIKVKFNESANGLDNDFKTMRLAIKLPVTNAVLTSIFQPTVTCVKENSFYMEIIPAFFQLQRECGIARNDFIDVFIHCYGARTSIEPNLDANVADENALLVLENIKHKGFKCSTRPNGFDKLETEVILENLGKFHALPIALRILRPKIFDIKVLPCLQGINLFEAIDIDCALTKSICRTVRRIEDMNTELLNKFFEQVKLCADKRKSRALEAHTPYTTISHSDLWTNNIMFTRDASDRMDKVKFFDFQLTEYNSFVNDLIFFLFTSVNDNVRRENIDHFFIHYHKHLYSALQLLGCPLNDYSYEKCRLEIKDKAKNELEHIIYRLQVILAEHRSTGGDLQIEMFLRDDHLGPLFYDALRNLLIEFEELEFL